MKKYGCFFLIVLLKIFLVKGFSQQVEDDIYSSFTNLSTQQGLSHNRVLDLYQDVYGFIWIATEDGLSRFDGYDFVTFKHDSRDSTSISGNFITSIVGDPQGNLWVGTTEGLNFYSRRQGAFIRYLSKYDDPNALKSNYIRALLLDETDNLWIETLDGILSVLDVSTMSMAHFPHSPIKQPYYQYHALWKDDDGSVWLGGRNLGLHILYPDRKTFRIVKAGGDNPSKKRDDDISSILKTGDGIYYVSGLDGVYTFNPSFDEFHKIYATSTYSIKEYEQGKILFGTGNGLVIYNPLEKSYTRYVHDIDNPNSLANNNINRVMVDRNGNIWLATNGGVSVLKKQKLGIKHFFHIPGNSQTLSSDRVSDILKDSKGNVWVGTENHGLNLWDTITNRFTSYTRNPYIKESIASNSVSKIYEDSKGNLWIGLWGGVGFNKFDSKGGLFTQYALDSSSMKRDWYNDIMEDSKGGLWMGVWGGNGVQQFDGKSGNFLSHNYWSKHVPINLDINHVVADGMGNLFITTPSSVLHQYDVTTKSFNAFLFNRKDYEAIPEHNRQFLKILPLEFDTLYHFATNSKGITLFATNRGLFSYNASVGEYSEMSGIQLGFEKVIYHDLEKKFWLLSKSEIIKLSETLDIEGPYQLSSSWKTLNPKVILPSICGKIWVTSDQGVFLYSSENQQIESIGNVGFEKPLNKCHYASLSGVLYFSVGDGIIYVSPNNLASLVNVVSSTEIKSITGITPLDSSRLFVSSTQGFAIMDCERLKLEPIPLKDFPIDFNYSITGFSAENNIGFIASHSHLYGLDTESGQLEMLNIPDKHMVSSRLTTCLLQDSEGYIWIGTSDNGINRMDPTTNHFRHFTTNNQFNPTPSDNIRCIHQDFEGYIWIGTDKGMCLYHPIQDRVMMPYVELLDMSINSIVQSSDSALWIGTNHGLIRFMAKTREYTLFEEQDGMPTSIFSRGACVLSDNEIAMGTRQGVVAFNPLVLTKKQELSSVLITGIDIYGHRTLQPLAQYDTIRLKYNENSFTIYFSSLDYNFSRDSRYVHTISGRGNKWVDANSNSVNYTHLSPGKYHFSVALKGNEGVKAKQGGLYIIIQPPFWKTIWFRSLIVLATLMVSSIAVLHYIRRIRISERNVILEQKLLVSQMNPHFISNSLSAIQSFVYGNRVEEAGNYLSDFSKLIRLILENSRSEWISISKEIQTLELYLDMQQLRFSNKFNYKIHVDPHMNIQSISIPPMLAQPFIENCIEHGIMYKQGMGNVWVNFSLQGNVVLIEVLDDGVGLQQTNRLTEHREGHKSFSTLITRERLANLNRQLSKVASIQIEDRFDVDGSSGVRVLITVPYQRLKVSPYPIKKKTVKIRSGRRNG